ncbi:HypA protein [Xylariaceae sp. FL1651]|nr:HypA protein [Xylariaceae sp. FL1651]
MRLRQGYRYGLRRQILAISASYIRSSTASIRVLHKQLTNMATAHTIQITTENPGLWHYKQSEAAAKKTTELLQEDLQKHHCFFNNRGFHNHISHYLLSLYGLGASPEVIQKGYNDNENYQRSPFQVHADQIEDLKDFEKAKEKLGNEESQKVLDEYLFKGDERSDDMLIRMFAGFIHPLIQLMYGVEWQQPAIVAMGLAQASVHNTSMGKFLLTAEEAAKSSEASMMTIASLFEDVAADEKLAASAHMSDDNKIRDGVLTRAFDEAIRVASKVKVKPEELEERTVEMYNTAIYQAAGAAIRPGKEPRFDFFLMHHVNVCPLFLAINAADWISTANKVRLLEWKIRFDLLQYAARACAPVSIEKITSYVPRDKPLKPTAELLPRIFALNDDGHVAKLVRAVGICQEVSKKFENKDWLAIKGDDLWNKLNHLIVDSVEAAGPRWVRGAGDAEAWKEVPDRREDGQGRL